MADPFRIVYMGTPGFAVPPLRALWEAGECIVAVVTQPDRGRGRGRRISPPPVKILARQLGLAVLQPERLADARFLGDVRALRPDVFVVAAYGEILRPSVLRIPRLMSLNIHASLLPRYRGAAPVQWAILRGEITTGVTVLRMDEGVDTGDIALQEEAPILPEDTSRDLEERLSGIGARLIVDALARLRRAELVFRSQMESLATYAPMLRKEDGEIDWASGCEEIRNRVRGLSPWPGAYTRLEGNLLKIWRARCLPGRPAEAPGTVVGSPPGALWVAAADGIVDVVEMQREGRKRLDAGDFLRGCPVEPGTRLG